MKKYVILIATALCLVASVAADARKAYGKAFKIQASQTPEQLVLQLQKQPTIQGVVVQGTIAQVCQAEGCWMKLKNKSGENIMVKFKDHSFLVPKDIAGRATIVYGTAMKKTISVEEQRHLAEDAGMTTAQIEAITTPKSEIRIEATGIVVD